MKALKAFLSKVFGFLFTNRVTVQVKDASGNWRTEELPGPVLFSELDERFGNGNWSL